MRRNWIALGLGVVCAALVANAGGAASGSEKKPLTTEQIKEMMTKTHKGEKSPFVRTREELKKDKLDWDQLAKDVKAFAEMADALKGAGIHTSPEKYISGATSLSKAVGEKDAKATNEAFKVLSKSCSSCHYGK